MANVVACEALVGGLRMELFDDVGTITQPYDLARPFTERCLIGGPRDRHVAGHCQHLCDVLILVIPQLNSKRKGVQLIHGLGTYA